MPGPTTESLATDFKELSRDINALREASAKFEGCVETHLNFIKWLGGFVATLLVSLVASAVWLSWNASALTYEVKQQGNRLGKVEARLDGVEDRLGAVEARLGAVERTLKETPARNE